VLSERSPSSQNHLADWIEQIQEENESSFQASEKKSEEMYTLAYMLYQNQNYQEATLFFRLLVEASPSNPKFWKGLGATLQMQYDYKGALNCYCCCAQLCDTNQTDPYLYVQTADCNFALKQIKEGLKALNIARSIAKKINDHRVLQHVTFMQQVWSDKGDL